MVKIKRRLSDAELDAITIYEAIPSLTVEMIAKLVHAPSWYVKNIIFKYLNGAVKGENLLDTNPQPPYKKPRSGLEPTSARIKLALEELQKSNIKLRKSF